MDIPQTLNAIAVVTLGKDMTLRDYAQGAYRMRGIGKGQTIRLFIIPEVQQLIYREMKKAGLKREKAQMEANILNDVLGWLVINSMQSERIQFNQLQIQNSASVWRKNAFNVFRDYGGSRAKRLAEQEEIERLAREKEEEEQKSALASKIKYFKQMIGLRVEAIDPVSPPSIYVAHIKSVKGAQLEICFDGWGDSSNFFVEISDTTLFPVGYCEANGKVCLPPCNYSEANKANGAFNWDLYLTSNRFQGMTAPSISAHVTALMMKDKAASAKSQANVQIEAALKKRGSAGYGPGLKCPHCKKSLVQYVISSCCLFM